MRIVFTDGSDLGATDKPTRSSVRRARPPKESPFTVIRGFVFDYGADRRESTGGRN
jgi:hypothetical protein